MISFVPDDAIVTAVERALDGWRVVALTRRPHPYATSHVLEAIDATLDDGSALALLRKELGAPGLLPGLRTLTATNDAHPGPDVEAAMYEHLLPELRDGAARWYATGLGEDGEPRWLLIERVAGVELWQIGEPRVWCAAAASVATMHAQLATRAGAWSAILPARDAAALRRTFVRAQTVSAGRGAATTVELLAALAPDFDGIVARVASLPPTIVHGDLYASNVLIGADNRVCPIDWERAATATGLLDLAALVAGWDQPVVDAMALAYRDAMQRAPGGADLLRGVDLHADLDRCRLCVAIDWLGAAPDWTPPAEHATDWLAEAHLAARRLGVAA